MTPKRFAAICEMYTAANSQLLRYMQRGDFDQYKHWYQICSILDDLGWLDAIGADNMEQAQDVDPSIWDTIDDSIKDTVSAEVYKYLHVNEPSELPTHQLMSLSQHRLIKRETWLAHFSDFSEDIQRDGFMYGKDQPDELALTTHTRNKPAHEAGWGPGYNFAVVADSRDAVAIANARRFNRYGSECCLFQNSGVSAYHHGDDEHQVMFFGPDVNRHSIVRLERNGGEWGVCRTDTEGYLYSGDFASCVRWVQRNFAQYKKVITI